MPAHDEHGVRNKHLCRITHSCVVCPAKVSHVGVNSSAPRGYSAARVKSCNGTVSALPHPAERRLDRVLPGVARRQVLAVAPGAARAVLVVPLAARNADHGLHCARLYEVRAVGITRREMASAFAGRRAVWPVRFPDRAAAGLLLGECLRLAIGHSYPERTVVTALPRGGVAVGAGVARCLGVPLEVLVTRKIGQIGRASCRERV